MDRYSVGLSRSWRPTGRPAACHSPGQALIRAKHTLRGVGKPGTLRAADENEGWGVEVVFKTRWVEGSVLVLASVRAARWQQAGRVWRYL